MQRSVHAYENAQTNKFNAQLRVHPAVHLCSGDMVGAFVEHATAFEDKPSFSLTPTTNINAHSAAQWVAEKIIDLAEYCDVTGNAERPMVLPIPSAAILDPNTIEAAINAVAQTRFCNQEISFELTDAALAVADAQAEDFIMACRKRGFRVSIDARQSHSASLPATAWLMIDTLRMHTADVDINPSLDEKVEMAASAGVAVVAQSPFWRDGEYLARLGVEYGLAPRTDA